MAESELNPAVTKAIARLEAALDAGSAYEGLQVAKTVSARLRSRGGKEDAADLLGRAAEALLRRKEITCGSELASNLLENYATDDVKLPGDVKADASGVMPPPNPGGDSPPRAVARLLRVLDAFSAAAAGGGGGASPSSSTSRPDPTSPLVAAARFASASTKWASGAGGGKELMGKLHLACAAALSSCAAASPESGDASASSPPSASSTNAAVAWGAAAPHWARATAAPADAVAAALDAAARQSDADADGARVGESERSAFLARAALSQVAARAGKSPHEAEDAVRGAQELATEFRKLCVDPSSDDVPSGGDALDGFLDLFLDALLKRSPPLASLAAREYGPVIESVPGLSECVDAAGSAAFEAMFGTVGSAAGGAGGGLAGLAGLLGGGGGAGGAGGGPDLSSMLGALLGGGGRRERWRWRPRGSDGCARGAGAAAAVNVFPFFFFFFFRSGVGWVKEKTSPLSLPCTSLLASFFVPPWDSPSSSVVLPSHPRARCGWSFPLRAVASCCVLVSISPCRERSEDAETRA